MRLLLLSIFFLFILSCSDQNHIRHIDGTAVSKQELTQKIQSLIASADVTGMAIIIFNSNWLNGFASQITISPLFFIGSALAVLLIAWTTLSYQSVKAALMNPVTALRRE